MLSKSYLYVEDDHMSRQVMEMLMRDVMGYNAYTIFADSTDFIDRVNALPDPPDIILLDIHVTPLDGFQMLEKLRATPRYHNSQIIALTASVMNEEIAQLREAGFDGTIGKPLDATQFPQMLQRLEAGESVWEIA